MCSKQIEHIRKVCLEQIVFQDVFKVASCLQLGIFSKSILLELFSRVSMSYFKKNLECFPKIITRDKHFLFLTPEIANYKRDFRSNISFFGHFSASTVQNL